VRPIDNAGIVLAVLVRTLGAIALDYRGCLDVIASHVVRLKAAN